MKLSAVLLLVFLLSSFPASAQAPGSCTGNLCGYPDACGFVNGYGCGCGAILIANTDLGDTYQYASDNDGDGIEDDFDNCPDTPNRDQADQDEDMFGDACDNCPYLPNPDQMPEDVVPGCERDTDGDGVQDFEDNCPLAANPDQRNTDGDVLGDLCDVDRDGDLVLNDDDNCDLIHNPDQLDCDQDGIGFVCDEVFCLEVPGADECLDPTGPFRVQAAVDQDIHKGKSIPLLLYANRQNRAIAYTWELIDKPSGSDARIRHPRGSSCLSERYCYVHHCERNPSFTPDKQGAYRVRLNAELVFEDDLHPGHTESTSELALTATSSGGSSGCATAPGAPGGPAPWWTLSGIVLVLLAHRARVIRMFD